MNLIEACIAIVWLLFGCIILAVMITVAMAIWDDITRDSTHLIKKRSRSRAWRKLDDYSV